MAHKHNIPVLVDAYQSAGSMPIDFDEISADFMVGGFLKYMLGIPGIGFLLAKENSPLIPSKTGWFAARNVFAMDINSYEPALDARRFEEGTPPIPSVYAAVTGLKLLLEVGLESIWRQNQSLHAALRQGFEGLDLDIKTPPQAGSHGVMIAIAATDEEKAVASLEESGVLVSSRGGNVRISPHFYNNASDVDELMRAVLGARELFS